MDEGRPADPDVLLAQWLEESDAQRSDTLLGALTIALIARIRRVVTARLRATARSGEIESAVDDIAQAAYVQLLERLREIKAARPVPSPIRDILDYAAVVAHNALNAHIRVRKRAWARLARNLRYLVSHSPAFASWMAGSLPVCSLAEHHGRARVSIGDLRDARERYRRACDPQRSPLDTLAHAILSAAGGPVALAWLITTAADWADVQEPEQALIAAEDETSPAERMPEWRPDAETTLLRRERLHWLWMEIATLKLQHRQVILLNLRDLHAGRIELFILLGIASFGQIAAALEMTPAALARLWPELPLSDARIAADLGISEADVSNRRKTARRRLVRRLAKRDQPPDGNVPPDSPSG